MSDVYRTLLEATINRLEDLRSHGVRHVPVGETTLKALANTTALLRSRRRTPATTAAPSGAARRPATATARKSPPAKVRETPVSASGPAPLTGGQKSLPMNRGALVGRRSRGAKVGKEAQQELRPTEEKVAAMKRLRNRVLPCRKCDHLAATRENVVFGVGDPNTKLLFVGEAPGADEDARGEPFVGRAGQLLTKIIQTMGLSRETVYIANILKCRPDTPGQSSGNRKPTASEMATCMPHLLDQIDIIQPVVIVALGATAIEGLFGKLDRGITRLRGSWLEFRETPVMPTYHPAYLLRNQSLATKRQVWEDMLQVMERLELPISAKQRNYFLKPA